MSSDNVNTNSHCNNANNISDINEQIIIMRNRLEYIYLV